MGPPQSPGPQTSKRNSGKLGEKKKKKKHKPKKARKKKRLRETPILKKRAIKKGKKKNWGGEGKKRGKKKRKDGENRKKHVFSSKIEGRSSQRRGKKNSGGGGKKDGKRKVGRGFRTGGGPLILKDKLSLKKHQAGERGGVGPIPGREENSFLLRTDAGAKKTEKWETEKLGEKGFGWPAKSHPANAGALRRRGETRP